MQPINSSRVWLELFAKSAATAVPPGSYILDAGAGNGPYKPLFTDMHYESADFCQVDKAYGAITHVCDLAAIPVPSERYDLVLCTQVLEHVSDPKEMLAELFRVLKPGGVLYASAPLFYEEHEAPYDYFRYTRFGLRYVLESVGFQVGQLQPLEGYFGALSYQLNMASNVLRNRSSEIIDCYGLLRFLLLRTLEPIFRGLACTFARMDTRSRFRAGICKNYTVVAQKPTPSS